MTDVMGQLEASLNGTQYLVKVCHVLTEQGASVKQIGNVMLKELGEDAATVHPPPPQSGASVASEADTPNTPPSNDESTSTKQSTPPQRSVSETGSTGPPQEARSPSKELNMRTVMKIFTPSAHHYRLIGIGLGVEVIDLKDTDEAANNLIKVFQRWFDADEDVSWDTLMELCDDYPDKLGKAKAKLNKVLSRQ
ncbi:PREDICTED: uncharacterized protein LOC109591008 [Amphimedon queenslandica]|uniref:Death domain-containing protein n=1 Tax=Amphimedon queenslandica TaxID=400682 RepID=A0AAN0JYT1_AMPQE|nr:PREDICTED: uncharacterized protein LOC109591008 [Amphimedon queenslandica]|eukprot:XP_019862383.1 PREDICTED: uncharacterized protein LOC109591008 [Amphimedon queenslandica]